MSKEYFLYFRDGDPPIIEIDPWLDTKLQHGNASKMFDSPILGDWCMNLRADTSSRLFERIHVNSTGNDKWEGTWLFEVDHDKLPEFVKTGLAMAFLLP